MFGCPLTYQGESNLLRKTCIYQYVITDALKTVYKCKERRIKLKTKVDVCRAVVLTTLLHAPASYGKHMDRRSGTSTKSMRCLRHITKIQWHDRTSNVEMRCQCATCGIEALIIRAQLRWAGYVV